MEITEQSKRLLGAVRDGKVSDEKTLGMWQILEEVLAAVKKLEDMGTKIEGKYDESKDSVIKGITPTEEKILELLTPLIPKVKDGETPDDAKLLSLITPLIPKAKNGKPGKAGKNADMPTIIAESTKAVEEKIKPLIPTVQDLHQEILKNPMLIRDSLESLEEGEKLDVGITVSATPPENPSIGQIWIDVS